MLKQSRENNDKKLSICYSFCTWQLRQSNDFFCIQLFKLYRRFWTFSSWYEDRACDRSNIWFDDWLETWYRRCRARIDCKRLRFECFEEFDLCLWFKLKFSSNDDFWFNCFSNDSCNFRCFIFFFLVKQCLNQQTFVIFQMYL